MRQGRRGTKFWRPFCERAGLRHRGLALGLQRVIVDFTSDHSFQKSAEKMIEHYGFALSPSRLHTLTIEHGKACADKTYPQAPVEAATQLITELDGTMVPLREKASDAADGRKQRHLYWGEARLSLAHSFGQTTMTYGAVLGDRFQAGLVWEQTASAAGYQSGSTKVHGVGDGARWITEEFEGTFGTDGRYLLDLYHVSEYLNAAAPVCAPGVAETWVKEQKERLLDNDHEQVLSILKQHREEGDETGPNKPPVRRTYDYLCARTGQLNYKDARAAELPIGSGAIEGNHRSVIHQRLKISGAWWLKTNANHMLNLRTMRANDGCWATYWNSLN